MSCEERAVTFGLEFYLFEPKCFSSDRALQLVSRSLAPIEYIPVETPMVVSGMEQSPTVLPDDFYKVSFGFSFR